MAKKASKPLPDPPKKRADSMVFRIEFKKFSIGEDAFTVSTKADINKLSPAKIISALCNKRIDGAIMVGDDDPAQTTIEGVTRAVIRGSFDTKRVSFGKKDFSFSLSTNHENVDMSILPQFSNHSGILVIDNVGEIPDKPAPQDNPDQTRIDDEDEE